MKYNIGDLIQLTGYEWQRDEVYSNKIAFIMKCPDIGTVYTINIQGGCTVRACFHGSFSATLLQGSHDL